MKASMILIAAMATISAAIVVPAQDAQPIQDRGVVNIGSDFTAGLLDTVAQCPGTKWLSELLVCMGMDKGWRADYSQKGNGVVVLTDMNHACCNKAQDGWNTYQKELSKFFTPRFNAGCTGGTLTKMRPADINTLRGVIGDGVQRQ